MMAVKSGTGAYAAASVFQFSVSYIDKAFGKRRASGKIRARRWPSGPQPKEPCMTRLSPRVMSEPDATLVALRTWLLTEHSMKVSMGWR